MLVPAKRMANCILQLLHRNLYKMAPVASRFFCFPFHSFRLLFSRFTQREFPYVAIIERDVRKLFTVIAYSPSVLADATSVLAAFQTGPACYVAPVYKSISANVKPILRAHFVNCDKRYALLNLAAHRTTPNRRRATDQCQTRPT